jgi:hypothetical protein
MISGIKPTALLFRDGTSQSDRLNAALDPDTIPVDERTTGDLIRFAQAFAEKLHFFDVVSDPYSDAQEVRPTATWEAFLIDDFGSYSRSTEKEKLLEAWIADLLDYIQNPDKYADDSVAIARFGKPHLALFVTFLQLTGILREQLNGFTKRHLDFYYREVLGLTEKQPVPDMVHVIVQLADHVNDFVLKNGTLLSAGKDATGKELLYRTTGDTHITQANIGLIRNVFTEKQLTGIREAREKNKMEPDAGVTAMLKLALGDPAPGKDLPKYNGKAFSFSALQADYAGDAAARTKAVKYGKDSLFLSEGDLKVILNLDPLSVDSEWETAYEILDSAYKDKVRYNRRQLLKQKRESDAAKGFMTMLTYALGSPNPEDNLPEYLGVETGINQLLQIYNQLFEEQTNTEDAQKYVRESLLLKEPEFKKIIDAYNDPAKSDWDSVYTLIEKAQSQLRNFQPESPYTEVYTNIFSIDDAKKGLFTLLGEEGENQRFKTFGKGTHNEELGHAVPAQLGFAFSSPQLLLTEGERKIAITLGFTNVSESLVLPDPKNTRGIFQVYLSSSEDWIVVDPESVVFRDVPSANGEPRRLFADAVLKLSENKGPVTAPGKTKAFHDFYCDMPVMALVLNNVDKAAEAPLPYIAFKELELEKISVNVEVSRLKALTLQNDTSAIDYKKPFEPFGFQASTDSSFYFTHPEIAMKRLDSLSVHLDWMKPPSKLGDYYLNYAKIAQAKLVPVAPFASPTSNTSLKADLAMKDGNTIVPVASVALFDETDAKNELTITISLAETLKKNTPAFNYTRLNQPAVKGDLFNWPRYFRLEMGAIDFQRDTYPILLTTQAYLSSTTADAAALKALVLNPPYTPKLKTFMVSYKASFSIEIGSKTNDPNDRLFHIHPFGYKTLDTVGTSEQPAVVMLLPDYTQEGELYIGIKDLSESRRLSILFQMAEGSADPDVATPEVSWSYLIRDTWKEFPAGYFIEDGTNGLLNTGIIVLNIPDDASNENDLLGEGLHWIRATIPDNSAGITDTVNILTQSVQAVFVDQGNDPAHLLTLLEPEKIKLPVTAIPEIKKLLQPYTSSKGKPAEAGSFFYNRVSERLRHKNRAITMWDYERIILDRFPEIHKVKCVPGDFLGNAENYGKVDVIVIPDIKGKLPFNPYQPKVAADLLLQVQEYVSQRAPAFADVQVKNATFVQVKTRFTVKFNEIGNEQYLTKILEDELKRYLAPWAFNEGADITLGGNIYASMLVNFIAERPYVDYVAGIKLFQSRDGIRFKESRAVDGGENTVTADQPDVILVSALEHEIDVVSDKGFEQKDFTGINYMKIELDFSIG